MNSKRTVLVGCDFSTLGQAAVRRAAMIAADQGSHLHIVHAFPIATLLDSVFAGGDWAARMQSDAEHRLSAMAAQARELGASSVSQQLMHGTAHRILAEAAESVRPELIVIGAHGRGALQQFFLGGTAARVLASAPCPVLVVRYAADVPYRRVLAALDLGPRSQHVLQDATRFARNAQLVPAHTFRSPHEARMRLHGASEAELSAFIDGAAHSAQESMMECLREAGMGQLTSQPRIVHGDTNPAIPDLARELEADLLVVGRHSGSRMTEAVLGSVPRFLAYYAPCDVLVV